MAADDMASDVAVVDAYAHAFADADDAVPNLAPTSSTPLPLDSTACVCPLIFQRSVFHVLYRSRVSCGGEVGEDTFPPSGE